MVKNRHQLMAALSVGILVFCSNARAGDSQVGAPPLAIAVAQDCAQLEQLAAREVRRYLYLRTGVLCPIVPGKEQLPDKTRLVVIGTKHRPFIKSLATSGWSDTELMFLKPQEYLLKTVRRVAPEPTQVWLLAGGDDLGTLYAAYRFAEKLGVRFYLHGDSLPEEPLRLQMPPADSAKGAERLMQFAPRTPAPVGLPDMDEIGRPLFALRGIQPFHDFPEGPDWWNKDDYMAVLSQLPKLRMNFFGLHTYPEGHPNAEPTVWIGPAGDVEPDGRVKASYPASYQNTLRGNWGYKAKKISAYSCGGSELFAGDAYGPDVMGNCLPAPTNQADCNAVFNRTGEMFRDVFRHARLLGIKTCIGTETPLTIPKEVQERLKAQGKDPKDIKTVQEIYEGIFTRIMRMHDLDYYWFWTPETWTWEGVKPEAITATTNDLLAAVAAARKVNAPFTLATCGWVLGPPQDRALFDKALPKEMPVSCINRQVGKTPVEKGFAKIQGRGKWAIPWLEDDPGLTAPQLWAARMRRDAADALRYGCDGLMGIHWRTRVLGPAVLALAQAAWNQAGWNQGAEPSVHLAGPEGGKYAYFEKAEIADTEEDEVYRSVRYDVSAYRLPVSNGAYTVTLKFCEPNYKEKGKRVFGVKIQDATVIESLDIFEKVGRNRALDYTFKDVQVTNGWLDITFIPQVEYPSIAALVVEGPGGVQKINCGGKAWKDYQADWPQESETAKQKYPPIGDFYLEWAVSEFGPDAGREAAKIFEKLDCKLPRTAEWVHGPGGLNPDKRPWEEASKAYKFLDELEALRPKIKGAGYRERLDYWLETFRYMKAMAQINCTMPRLTNALAEAKAQKEPAAQKQAVREKVLPIRRELVKYVTEMYRHLLAIVSNPGELGTVANWEQHIFPDLLEKPAKEMEQILGEPLPADCQLPKQYQGPPRLIVPTVRTSFRRGESLALTVIILAEKPPKQAALYWRPMGRGALAKVPLEHVGRGVYLARFPAAALNDDVEYHLRASWADGTAVYFPATAPMRNQTMVAQ